MKDWNPADWAVVIIATAIGLFVVGSMALHFFTNEPLANDDGGTAERVILGLASIITLYIGLRFKGNSGD